jgi:hypothetical protein
MNANVDKNQSLTANELTADEIDAVAGGRDVHWGQVGAGAAIGGAIGSGFGGVGAPVGAIIGGVIALAIDLF